MYDFGYKPIDIRPKQIQEMTSAKKSSDGVSHLLNMLFSAMGDETSKGNASTIYNIMKLLM